MELGLHSLVKLQAKLRIKGLIASLDEIEIWILRTKRREAFFDHKLSMLKAGRVGGPWFGKREFDEGNFVALCLKR
jgi:hypothetical protein